VRKVTKAIPHPTKKIPLLRFFAVI